MIDFIAKVITYYLILILIGIGAVVLLDAPIVALVIAVCAVVLTVTDRTEIKVKYFVDNMLHIRKIPIGDWVDLRASERVELKAGESALIPLGVGMILPKGYEAHLLPRSSTLKKFGIVCGNSMGIIDNSYSGDDDMWHFSAVALRDTVIEKNERICQFRIVKSQPKLSFRTVLKLNDKSRGGFGSTGKA